MIQSVLSQHLEILRGLRHCRLDRFCWASWHITLCPFELDVLAFNFKESQVTRELKLFRREFQASNSKKLAVDLCSPLRCWLIVVSAGAILVPTRVNSGV